MQIHEQIRKHRRQAGLTQEQLANCLGVSTPAVSKWENGITYPDVTLLPALARLLKIDMNTLMCFKENLTKQEIAGFLLNVSEIIKSEGIDAGFKAAMDKIQEYPNCIELLHSSALTLESSLLMSGMTEDEKETYMSRIITLYERAADSGDQEIAVRARYMLASRLVTLGQYEKAQEMLDLLPQWNALDKRGIQAELWSKQEKYAEAGELLERMLLGNLQSSIITMDRLAALAVSEGNQAAADAIASCAKTMCETFGLGGYNSNLVSLQAAISGQNIPDSLAALNAMFKAAVSPWVTADPVVFPHIVPKYEGAPADIGKKILKPLLAELENNHKYDFLRGRQEFQDLLDTYKTYCEI